PVALQVSKPLHTLLSVHENPAGRGAWETTPVVVLQLSKVHGLLSFTLIGVPCTHVPDPLQVSRPLQGFPSVHDVPAADSVCVTAPVDGSHASSVQALPSLTLTGVPPTQFPAPSHVSAPLHGFPSAHDVPPGAGACCTPPLAVHVSIVHGL